MNASLEDLENEMLNALELLHYAGRFRGSRFSIVLEEGADFGALELDLRLLQGAGIETAVISRDTPSLREHIGKASGRGAKIQVVEKEDSPSGGCEMFSSGAIAVLLINHHMAKEVFSHTTEFLSLSKSLGSKRTIFISPVGSLRVNGIASSYPTIPELEQYIDQDFDLNVPKTFLIEVLKELESGNHEVSLLGTEPGGIFREVFTHRGKGTFFSTHYPNEIRRATLADTHQISLMLRPSMLSKSVLPLTEDQIAADIERYSVYTVNNQIVALAKLTQYENSVEIGKFATLPRYQGRGRAKELAKHLIEQARQAKRDQVFALSTNPKMWEFFEGLGFCACARESLPESWQQQYDFSRASRAFALSIGGEGRTMPLR